MKLGIVGLPNVGKSMLFNALTKAQVDSANYPFCTIEPNIGVVPVPDERLNALEHMYAAKLRTHATIEFVDIAGLVRGASQGQGLGNKFLAHIREVDAIAHVVRCFDDENVVHVDGSPSPERDIETIELELILADLEAVDKRIQKVSKALKADKGYAQEYALLQRLKEGLEAGKLVKNIQQNEDEHALSAGLGLLTNKPVIYVANVSDENLSETQNHPYLDALSAHAERQGAPVVKVCAKLEGELAELKDEERAIFLSELGIGESGLSRLISAGYEMLGLISFLTAGPKEVRAWTIRSGTNAASAGGKIHSDIERGFIRAEIVPFLELETYGSHASAKEKGAVRLEGRDYIVKDGDVILFRFNV